MNLYGFKPMVVNEYMINKTEYQKISKAAD